MDKKVITPVADQVVSFVSFNKKLNGFGYMKTIQIYSRKQWVMKKKVIPGSKMNDLKN